MHVDSNDIKLLYASACYFGKVLSINSAVIGFYYWTELRLLRQCDWLGIFAEMRVALVNDEGRTKAHQS